MAYFGMAFGFLTFEKFHIMHSNYYYSMHFLMPIVAAFAVYMPKVRQPTKD
jgi:hypothetical protein